MKKKYIVLFLLITQIYQAYSQNKLGKSVQFDVTLQNFLNVGMFDNFFDKEFLEVQENSYFSPSMDVSFLLTQDRWNFGLELQALV